MTNRVRKVKSSEHIDVLHSRSKLTVMQESRNGGGATAQRNRQSESQPQLPIGAFAMDSTSQKKKSLTRRQSDHM